MVRQAVELGADIIKADPTDDVTEYHQVIEIAGRIPVLVRGGGKAPDQEVLQRTEALIQQGAAGIVYGRNVIQHRHPAGMTRALLAIVHEGATAAQAAALLQESQSVTQPVRVGIIGGGLMGREVASALSRWFVLDHYPVRGRVGRRLRRGREAAGVVSPGARRAAHH